MGMGKGWEWLALGSWGSRRDLVAQKHCSEWNILDIAILGVLIAVFAQNRAPSLLPEGYEVRQCRVMGILEMNVCKS